MGSGGAAGSTAFVVLSRSDCSRFVFTFTIESSFGMIGAISVNIRQSTFRSDEREERNELF